MIRRLAFCVLSFLATLVSVEGQVVGDSTDQVRRLLGEPSMVRKSATGEVWVFDDGLRIKFAQGVVAEIIGDTVNDGYARAARADVPMNPVNSHVTVAPVRRETATARSVAGPATEAKPPRARQGGVVMMGLIIVLGVVCVGSSIWFYAVAFQQGILWGLGTLFVPLVGLFLLISHWEETRKPFLLSFLSSVAVIALTAVAFPS